MNRPGRRQFLATVGVGAAGVAGCTSLADQMPATEEEEDDGEEQETTTDTPEQDEDEDEEEEQTEEPSTAPPAIEDGDVIDDFEEEVDLWGTIRDSTQREADTDEFLTGSQSLRVEAEDDVVAGVFKAFPDALDLSARDLSLAVKVESPRPSRVTVEVMAPGRADHLVSHRTILPSFDGWLRMDVGYTGERGEPNLENIQEMRILIEHDGDEPFRFWVDDMRATPRAETGAVMFTFDDAVASQYDTAFPMLEERGWPAVAAVMPSALNAPGRLEIGELREMRDAGWDVSAHPHEAGELPDRDPEGLREDIDETRQYLEQRGFPDGARHFFVPFNDLTGEDAEVIREVYETSWTFGGNPSALPPTDTHVASRINGTDVQGVRRLVNLADQYNQLVVLYMHGVGDGDNDDITEDDFGRLLDHVGERDVEVVTASDVLDGDY